MPLLTNSLSWILGEKEDEEIEDRDRMADERFERLAKVMEESEGKPREDGARHESSSRGSPLPLTPDSTIDLPLCQRQGPIRMIWIWIMVGFYLRDFAL